METYNSYEDFERSNLMLLDHDSEGDDTRGEVRRQGKIEVENEEVEEEEEEEEESGYDSDCIYIPPPPPQVVVGNKHSSGSTAVGGKGLFAVVTSGADRIISGGSSQVLFDLT
jgi:hypothetical protein